jgi:hypothetical protein
MPAQNSADKVLIDGENLTLEQILAVPGEELR